MSTIYKTLTIGFLIMFFWGCSSSNEITSVNDNSILVDSLVNYTLDSNILIVFSVNDTLKIVSTNKFTYFPFGKYSSIEGFKKSNKLFKADKEYQYPFNDSTLDMETLHILTFNKSRLKLYFDTDEKQVLIVSGEIKDKEIVLTNSTQIGLSKKEFLAKYFSKSPSNLDKINVIELESGLSGAWHYYSFIDDKLVNIYFDSDFQFVK